MTRRDVALFLFVLSLGACTPAPAPRGDCAGRAAATQTFEIGVGSRSFTPIATADETPLERGPQGGYHVWLAFRSSGFEPEGVAVRVSATDAYSGEMIARGEMSNLSLNQMPMADAETCGFTGIPLFLFGHPRRSAGLAVLEATIVDVDGRTATDKRQVWLGTAAPACVPVAGDAPWLEPAHISPKFLSPLAVEDGATIQVPRSSAGEDDMQFTAYVRGLAASAIILTMELRDPTAGPEAAPIATVKRVPSTTAPELDAADATRCLLPSATRVPVDGAIGRPVDLLLRADDGHGGVVEAARRITLVRD